MRFSELLDAAGVETLRREGDADVSDVQADSRRCRAGSCFVAVKGTEADGHKFIASAVAAGASAVVSQRPPGARPAAWARVADTREAIGPLAQAIRGWPARRMTCIAVTGTNGKTTVAHLVREMLAAAGHRPALLGTIAYETGRRSLPAGTTTPGPADLAEMTAEMVAGGRTHLVMEASSHALDQRRTAGLDFRVGIFTNLSGDHLDYHGTMERYLRAKRRLFEQLPAGSTAVLNRDDRAAEALAAATEAEVCWYGLSRAADLWARIERIESTGTDVTLIHGERRQAVRTTLIGRHNVYNCLAAAGACLALGVEMPVIAEAIASVPCVPGRLQRVEGPAGFEVFVDYAHTDDALDNVLGALRPVTRGRLIVVFGCGGDRDRTKRPRMARVAERHADRIVVTSDNPRSEEPAEIIGEILTGLSAGARRAALVEPDRRAAIAAAIDEARDGDVVLIAGKGHETYQILGTRRVHFDDVEVAGEALACREARP